MKLTQISVFLENRKGRLQEVCEVLGNNGINIRALTVAESDDFGVMRIVVDNPQETTLLLKANGFVANLTEVVGVEVPDKPGGLADVLKVVSQHKINIEYMYGFLEPLSTKALLVFRFDDADRAIEALKEHKFKLVSEVNLGKR
jgi:hypothetical protein